MVDYQTDLMGFKDLNVFADGGGGRPGIGIWKFISGGIRYRGDFRDPVLRILKRRHSIWVQRSPKFLMGPHGDLGI